MRFEHVYIHPKASWSSPFCKWQGSLSNEHALKLAAQCADRKLNSIGLDAGQLDGLHLGTTVPQHQSFYGAPWVASMLGAGDITGPTLAQACATSARVIASAASQIELGAQKINLALCADRISNGPNLYYPNPAGPGGVGRNSNWVWDSFNQDPNAKIAMIETAENIAARFGFNKEQQDELVVLRYQQYLDALKRQRKFQKQYMIDIEVGSRKAVKIISEDEGITQTTSEGVKKLKPVLDQGTVTFASQTHPADGNAGMILASENELNGPKSDSDIKIRLLSFGEARAEKGYMGMAPVPAAQNALRHADIALDQIKAIKTHNPFVVNDLYFAHATGYAAENMNNFGCSLIFGHPQGPTGMRLVIELIEELVLKGGGYGLFTGCAAGDTAAALVIQVDD